MTLIYIHYMCKPSREKQAMKNLKLFILTLCVSIYSLESFSKTILVTDIDDTIKKANSMGGFVGLYHFFKKKPYGEIRDLYNELKSAEDSKGEEISYYYVSAAPAITFKAEKWIEKNDFPSGPAFLKTHDNKGNTYDFKHRTIKAILEKELKSDPELKVFFFGDNSQYDGKVYYDLNNEMNLKANIYIRDVSTEATFFSASLPVLRLPGVHYYFSEMELLDLPDFIFMSEELKSEIIKNYKNKSLVPKYTLGTLEDRLKDICKKAHGESCKCESKEEALKYWNDYYTRFDKSVDPNAGEVANGSTDDNLKGATEEQE
jgi:hypothetical protein